MAAAETFFLRSSAFSNFYLAILLLGVVALFTCLFWLSTATDIKLINGLPEIPGALPFVGHLPLLGGDYASVCQKWWLQYNYPIFQIRLGNTRAIVVNSFEDCKQMLIGHQSTVIDRPGLHTAGIIASTQALTIGASPWDESCRRRRKVAGAALARPAMKSYLNEFDPESYNLIKELEETGQLGTLELSVNEAIQRYSLNVVLTVCYGFRIDESHREDLHEILRTGHAISRLRGVTENWQDYILAMRYLPKNDKTARSKELAARRDRYLGGLLDTAKDMIRKGTDRTCVSSAVFRDEESQLSSIEVTSVCLSLVSGGFETVPATLIACIGSLSTAEGQIIQENAFEDICRYYPDVRDAWRASVQEEKVPYVNAIIKEALRYYTVTPMSPPRRTVSDLDWNGVVIPAKTMILINTQAANHDASHFGPTADQFSPSRWLDPNAFTPTELPSNTIQHFAFGAGSRACSGIALTNRELYTVLVRLITSYRIVASETAPPETDYVEFNSARSALVAVPRDVKVRLMPRNMSDLQVCLEGAEGRIEKMGRK